MPDHEEAGGVKLRLALQAVSQRLGHRFTDPSLLAAVLTHASFVNEHSDAGPSYERLEFVGDAVLDLLAAHILYTTNALAAEGAMSKRRAQLVQRDTLARLAGELELGPSIRLGRGNGGVPGMNVLADVFEAVAGAVFVDGGFEAVERCFARLMGDALACDAAPQDYKSRLQEAAHKRGFGVPVYVVGRETGPAHARQFDCCVCLGDDVYGRACASGKKAAEQLCARQALCALGLITG